MTGSGKAIIGGSRERAMGVADFKEAPRFLKSNRILLADGLTRNKNRTFTHKLFCFLVISRNILTRAGRVRELARSSHSNFNQTGSASVQYSSVP